MDVGNTEASNMKTVETVVLDDDKAPSDHQFQGATLEISGSGNAETESRNDSTNTSSGPQLSRDRPGSVIGRTSVRSTSSRTSMRPNITHTEKTSGSFYCYKESQFDKAVTECKRIIKPELDGEFIAAWLLTEIDHWDMEREKLVFLTTYSMFIIKFNFINNSLYEYRRIMLHIINKISIGDFKYPNSSFMPERQHGGIQISWLPGDQQLSFGQKWNPWCSDIPWTTLSHHPIIYNPKENETATYNVDEFHESLVTQASKAIAEKRPGETLKVVEGQIEIESYASLPSMVFNQSSLGFFKDRNGMCF